MGFFANGRNFLPGRLLCRSQPVLSAVRAGEDQKMPKHHGQARAAYALASAGIPFDTPQTNLPPLIGICRANPGALRKTCPPVSAFGRVFFRVGFLAWLNVPFIVSAHPFMARQCFSTARLRQQLVLAGPLRATRARLQPTSSTFVELAPVDSGYAGFGRVTIERHWAPRVR